MCDMSYHMLLRCPKVQVSSIPHLYYLQSSSEQLAVWDMFQAPCTAQKKRNQLLSGDQLATRSSHCLSIILASLVCQQQLAVIVTGWGAVSGLQSLHHSGFPQTWMLSWLAGAAIPRGRLQCGKLLHLLRQLQDVARESSANTAVVDLEQAQAGNCRVDILTAPGGLQGRHMQLTCQTECLCAELLLCTDSLRAAKMMSKHWQTIAFSV